MGKSKTCKKLKSKNKCDKKKAVEECKKTCGHCPDSGRNSNVRYERVFKATILSEYECKDEVSNCKKKTKNGKKCYKDKFMKGCISYCGLCPGMG